MQSVKILEISTKEYEILRTKQPYRLSQSLAHAIVDSSPLHAVTQLTSPEASTKAQDEGSILHALILGKGKEFAITDGFKTKTGKDSLNWQSVEAKAFRELAVASGRIPMFVQDFEKYQSTADILKSKIQRLVEDKLHLDWSKGITEQAMEWEEDGVGCRAQIDWRFEATILDLKIWDSVNPLLLPRKAYNMGIDIQSACYRSVIEQMNSDYQDRSTYAAVICESEPPYAVTLGLLHPQLAAIGERRWNDAKNQFRICSDSGNWAGYPDITTIEAELWMLRRHEISVYPEAIALGGEEYNADDWNTENEW